MSEAEETEEKSKRSPQCSICQTALVNSSKSSFEGAPVHGGCFARVGGHHRYVARPGRRFRRTMPVSTTKSLKYFAETTPNGRAWLDRKRNS